MVPALFLYGGYHLCKSSNQILGRPSNSSLERVELREIRGRTTVALLGNRDQRSRVEESERLFAALPVQDKLMAVVEGAVHEDLYEFDREGYRKRLVSFLERVDAKLEAIGM